MMLPVVGDCPVCDKGKFIEHVSRGFFEDCGRIIYYKHLSNICYHCGREFISNEQVVANRKEIQKRKLEVKYD